MSYRDPEFDRPGDELRDEELPDDFDSPDDDSAETIACPNCGADLYDDAVYCPHCGQYVTPTTSPWAGRPWWWIALAVLGVLAVVVVLGLGR